MLSHHEDQNHEHHEDDDDDNHHLVLPHAQKESIIKEIQACVVLYTTLPNSAGMLLSKASTTLIYVRQTGAFADGINARYPDIAQIVAKKEGQCIVTLKDVLLTWSEAMLLSLAKVQDAFARKPGPAEMESDPIVRHSDNWFREFAGQRQSYRCHQQRKPVIRLLREQRWWPRTSL